MEGKQLNQVSLRGSPTYGCAGPPLLLDGTQFDASQKISNADSGSPQVLGRRNHKRSKLEIDQLLRFGTIYQVL